MRASSQRIKGDHGPKKRMAVFLLWVGILMLLTPSYAQQNLPDMGEPADNALSPQQESQLGAAFMRRIRASVPLIRDTQVNEYLQNLGTRLASSARSRYSNDYTFFILEDAGINAFAIPGGYIGVNAGLITAMTREDQFAGVIAHEVAHLTQRHHARAYETAGRNRLSTAAAILAAIVIGASNPEAGQAALAAGLAISQQTAINYTRTHEYEADRIGIQILHEADYDPVAIAETFEIMRRKNSINASATQIEYLRTHPLDNNRIAEARSRAASMTPKSTRTNLLDFRIFQERLNILLEKDETKLKQRYRSQLNKPEHREAASYAMAVLSERSRKYDDAETYLKPLLKKYRGNVYLQLLAGQIQHGKNQYDKSRQTHERLLTVYPTRYSVVEQYARQLSDDTRPRQAIRVLRRYLQTSSQPNPNVWRELAAIQETAGDTVDSHESLARYYLGLNEFRRAQVQLEYASKAVRKGSQDELRIRSLLRDNTERLSR